MALLQVEYSTTDTATSRRCRTVGRGADLGVPPVGDLPHRRAAVHRLEADPLLGNLAPAVPAFGSSFGVLDRVGFGQHRPGLDPRGSSSSALLLPFGDLRIGRRYMASRSSDSWPSVIERVGGERRGDWGDLHHDGAGASSTNSSCQSAWQAAAADMKRDQRRRADPAGQAAIGCGSMDRCRIMAPCRHEQVRRLRAGGADSRDGRRRRPRARPGRSSRSRLHAAWLADSSACRMATVVGTVGSRCSSSAVAASMAKANCARGMLGVIADVRARRSNTMVRSSGLSGRGCGSRSRPQVEHGCWTSTAVRRSTKMISSTNVSRR